MATLIAARVRAHRRRRSNEPMVRHDEMCYDAALPRDAGVRSMQVRRERVLVVPWGVAGRTPAGLVAARNVDFPPIFGWIVGVGARDRLAHVRSGDPDLRPGCMVLFQRHATERVGTLPIGDGVARLPIEVMHIDAVEAVFDPPLATPPYAHQCGFLLAATSGQQPR